MAGDIPRASDLSEKKTEATMSFITQPPKCHPRIILVLRPALLVWEGVNTGRQRSSGLVLEAATTPSPQASPSHGTDEKTKQGEAESLVKATQLCGRGGWSTAPPGSPWFCPPSRSTGPRSTTGLLIHHICKPQLSPTTPDPPKSSAQLSKWCHRPSICPNQKF